MFGWKFAKFEPNLSVRVIRKGRMVREGQGLAFWFYVPTTSIIKIPLETRNIPFVFEEISQDFQTLTIQGDIVYKIADTAKIVDQVNFTIDTRTRQYLSDDPDKIDQRIINIVKTLAKSSVARLSLREALTSVDATTKALKRAAAEDPHLADLGIKVTNVNILSIVPNKETSRALEAETRENILREADDAVYLRRNSAVEQERRIKENELATEVAVEEKKRLIRETQIEGQRSVKEKERVILGEELAFKIRQENENTRLVELAMKNRKMEADVRGYALGAVLEPLMKADAGLVRALSALSMNPEQLIAAAFGGLAEHAERIGELNISPELLQDLLKSRKQ